MVHSPLLTENPSQLTELRIQNSILKESLRQVQKSLDEIKQGSRRNFSDAG